MYARVSTVSVCARINVLLLLLSCIVIIILRLENELIKIVRCGQVRVYIIICTYVIIAMMFTERNHIKYNENSTACSLWKYTSIIILYYSIYIIKIINTIMSLQRCHRDGRRQFSKTEATGKYNA